MGGFILSGSEQAFVTLGDASALGKPIGNDLKRGKNTSLVAAAREKLAASELLVPGKVVQSLPSGQTASRRRLGYFVR